MALGAHGLPSLARAATPVRFGVDMFSLNAQNWTPFQQLDFAAKWNAKVVHFSEIRFLGTLEPDNLRRVRARADELNSTSRLACARSVRRPRCSTRRRGPPKSSWRR